MRLLPIIFLLFGCNASNLPAEIQSVCSHIEGTLSTDCNAGDDFSPLNCSTALIQYEGWWRDDIQTAVNKCVSSAACYPPETHQFGSSIVTPLQSCQAQELSGLQPTQAEIQAVNNYCTQAAICGLTGSFTITDCENFLLSSSGDGALFLVMNDNTAKSMDACKTSNCSDLNTCVENVFYRVGAFNSVMGAKTKMPTLLE